MWKQYRRAERTDKNNENQTLRELQHCQAFRCARIKTALESFCYPPFIFSDLSDFTNFISNLPAAKLGILLEVGHLYQAGFNIDEAIQTFGKHARMFLRIGLLLILMIL